MASRACNTSSGGSSLHAVRTVWGLSFTRWMARVFRVALRRSFQSRATAAMHSSRSLFFSKRFFVNAAPCSSNAASSRFRGLGSQPAGVTKGAPHFGRGHRLPGAFTCEFILYLDGAVWSMFIRVRSPTMASFSNVFIDTLMLCKARWKVAVLEYKDLHQTCGIAGTLLQCFSVPHAFRTNIMSSLVAWPYNDPLPLAQ